MTVEKVNNENNDSSKKENNDKTQQSDNKAASSQVEMPKPITDEIVIKIEKDDDIIIEDDETPSAVASSNSKKPSESSSSTSTEHLRETTLILSAEEEAEVAAETNEDVHIKKSTVSVSAAASSSSSSSNNVQTTKNKKIETQRHVWISNVPKNTKATDLKKIFSDKFNVESAKVMTNGKSFFGYLCLETAEMAQRSVKELSGTLIFGKKIGISLTRPDLKVNRNNNNCSSSTSGGGDSSRRHGRGDSKKSTPEKYNKKEEISKESKKEEIIKEKKSTDKDVNNKEENKDTKSATSSTTGGKSSDEKTKPSSTTTNGTGTGEATTTTTTTTDKDKIRHLQRRDQKNTQIIEDLRADVKRVNMELQNNRRRLRDANKRVEEERERKIIMRRENENLEAQLKAERRKFQADVEQLEKKRKIDEMRYHEDRTMLNKELDECRKLREFLQRKIDDIGTTGGGGGGGGYETGPNVAILEGELEVIREILGNGAVEDGLEEGLDVIGGHHHHVPEIQEIDEMHIPDEAFYRSLNQAYEAELVECDDDDDDNDDGVNSSMGHLDMIWEEREEMDEEKKTKTPEKDEEEEEEEEVYSALDYKDYRGNTPCISEQDIAELSRINSIDHIAIEKLNELDRLSSKLQQDSANIKQLQRKLMESPISLPSVSEEPSASSEQCRQDDNNWTFSCDVRNQGDLVILAKTELTSAVSSSSNTCYASTRPNSRLSVTDPDKEVADTLAGGIRTPPSPRQRLRHTETSSTEPFSTVDGRLAYSAAVQHVECAEAAAAAAAAIRNSKNPFYCSDIDLAAALMSVQYETEGSRSPSIFHQLMADKQPSPTLSISSIRTRKDGYLDPVVTSTISPPPPPAPNESNNLYLGANSMMLDHLSPNKHHSTSRSPRTSPKRSKSHSSNIVTVKSDSGLSSMSGWSSLEKSPGSPKNKIYNYFNAANNRPASPNSCAINSSGKLRNFAESSLMDSSCLIPTEILPGGHHLSAFTNVKSPNNIQLDSYGTFVPAPAPASDINVSPNRNNIRTIENLPDNNSQINFGSSSYLYHTSQPAIYSVAGSNNKDSYTSVYTSNSADYINQTINYPDLIEPYENNNDFNNSMQQQQATSSFRSDEGNLHRRKKSLSRSYSINKPPDGLANHDGYKTAMYRTMFPTGNITDALSYYPTSSTRFDPKMMPVSSQQQVVEEQHFNNSPDHWQNNNNASSVMMEGNYPDTASTSSSMKSAETAEATFSPYAERKYQEIISSNSQPIYENASIIEQQQQHQQQRNWNQRQETLRLDLNLRNRNVPEYIVQHRSQSSGGIEVIMTESGEYITINNNSSISINNSKTSTTATREEKRKLKRGNTLKSAMNSVSNWLPDLNITKRHRSYSLPGGVQNKEELMMEKSRNSASAAKSNLGRKTKKRNTIVSTVSGILQKAKRKVHGSHQSLSDPEQLSENEWVIKRANSVVSDDDIRSEDSTSISENLFEKDLFPKINTSSKQISKKPPQEEEISQFSMIPIFDTVKKSPSNKDEQLDLNAESLIDEDYSIKSTGSGDGSNSLFPLIGEAKKISSGSSDKSSDETVIVDGKMVMMMNSSGGGGGAGTSMEFAVSRALGKYRKKHSNNIVEDLMMENDDSDNIKIDEIYDDGDDDNNECNNIDGQFNDDDDENVTHLEEQTSFELGTDKSDEISTRDPSPCSRLNIYSLPRQQQSLEIPNFRDDEDSRSTHSFRSTSRISSRRQSTEDSVISEDDMWYKHNLLELEMQQQREKMTFVLRELRMKAKVVEGVLDEKSNNLLTVHAAKRRNEEKRGSFHLDEAAALFEKIKNYHHETLEREKYEEEAGMEIKQQPIEEQVIKELQYLEEPLKDEDDRSSGATSGPDSPHQSTDEYDENEMQINDEFARCHITSEEQEELKNREIGMQQRKYSAQSSNYNDEQRHQSIPEIQVASATPNKEEPPKDKQDTPPGSKWKLLKTLKERKAEEKNNQTKTATETAAAAAAAPESTPEEKVSMLGLMKNFYEIHVKT